MYIIIGRLWPYMPEANFDTTTKQFNREIAKLIQIKKQKILFILKFIKINYMKEII